jgi:hypothetical protein
MLCPSKYDASKKCKCGKQQLSKFASLRKVRFLPEEALSFAESTLFFVCPGVGVIALPVCVYHIFSGMRLPSVGRFLHAWVAWLSRARLSYVGASKRSSNIIRNGRLVSSHGDMGRGKGRQLISAIISPETREHSFRRALDKLFSYPPARLDLSSVLGKCVWRVQRAIEYFVT